MNEIRDLLLEAADILNEDAANRHYTKKMYEIDNKLSEYLDKADEADEKARRYDHIRPGSDAAKIAHKEAKKYENLAFKADGDLKNMEKNRLTAYGDEDFINHGNKKIAGVKSSMSCTKPGNYHYLNTTDDGKLNIDSAGVGQDVFHVNVTARDVEGDRKRKKEAKENLENPKDLHDRINARTKEDEQKNHSHKSTQHEAACIRMAELLQEAAMILNEESENN